MKKRNNELTKKLNEKENEFELIKKNIRFTRINEMEVLLNNLILIKKSKIRLKCENRALSDETIRLNNMLKQALKIEQFEYLSLIINEIILKEIKMKKILFHK